MKKGHIMSDAHKRAISKSLVGKKSISEEHKQKISNRMKNNHPRSLLWVLIDPDNQIIRTSKISELCKDRKLSYSILRYKAQNNDGTPIIRGASKGWIVLGTSKK